MSYVWTPEQVKSFYPSPYRLTFRGQGLGATFSTTAEFARAVLPPCLDPAPNPQVSVGANTFMDWRKGVAGVDERDTSGAIRINAVHNGREGAYYLTAIEAEDGGIAKGRDLWGMPKKYGTVDFFDDGRNAYLYVERKNRRLISLEADLGEVEEVDPEAVSTGWYFELKAAFTPDGIGITQPQLLVFERESILRRSQRFTDAWLELGRSHHDPGVETIPVGAFQEGRTIAGDTTFKIHEMIDLAGDGNDYAPYVFGRMYTPY